MGKLRLVVDFEVLNKTDCKNLHVDLCFIFLWYLGQNGAPKYLQDVTRRPTERS
jgi:hypothetical protein